MSRRVIVTISDGMDLAVLEQSFIDSVQKFTLNHVMGLPADGYGEFTEEMAFCCVSACDDEERESAIGNGHGYDHETETWIDP